MAIPVDRQYERLKLVSLGDSACGKSCLIKRYCEKKFVSKYISTIGVDFGVRSIPFQLSKSQASILQSTASPASSSSSSLASSSSSANSLSLKINFFDTSGADEYKLIRREFYTNCQILVLVFDVNSTQSFENIDKKWRNEFKQFNASTTPLSSPSASTIIDDSCIFALCGNKVSDDSSIKRCVSEILARQFATSNQWSYYECSAKSGQGVEEMFNDLMRQYVDMLCKQYQHQ